MAIRAMAAYLVIVLILVPRYLQLDPQILQDEDACSFQVQGRNTLDPILTFQHNLNASTKSFEKETFFWKRKNAGRYLYRFNYCIN